MGAKLTRLTHKIVIQMHLVAELYNLQFSLQAASQETFGYSLVCVCDIEPIRTTCQWESRCLDSAFDDAYLNGIALILMIFSKLMWFQYQIFITNQLPQNVYGLGRGAEIRTRARRQCPSVCLSPRYWFTFVKVSRSLLRLPQGRSLRVMEWFNAVWNSATDFKACCGQRTVIRAFTQNQEDFSNEDAMVL